MCRPLLDIGQTGTYVLCWILVKQVYVHYTVYWSHRYICTMMNTGKTGTYTLCWILVKQVHMYWSNRYIRTMPDIGQTGTYICTCQCCFCMAQCTYCYVCIHCPLLLLVVDQSCCASQYIASIHSLPTSVAGYGPQSPCFMMCNMYTFTAHFCSCLGTTVTLLHDV